MMKTVVASGLCILLFSSHVSGADVDGGWTSWDSNAPCCNGKQVQTRTCTNPPPSGSGKFCAGPSKLTFTCSPDNCTNGGWGEWSDFGPCCYGQKRRTRVCLAASVSDCEGNPTELQTCEREGDNCYTPNNITGMCEVQPFDLVNPSNTYELQDDCCTLNFPSFVDTCMGTGGAPVNGGWGNWTDYNACCFGIQTRFRVCNNPRPANGGASCVGAFSEDRSCKPDSCTAPSANGGNGNGGGNSPSTSTGASGSILGFSSLVVGFCGCVSTLLLLVV